MKIRTVLYEKRRKFSMADMSFYPKIDVGRGSKIMGSVEGWEMK